jgi:hypothetical protein
VVVDLDLHPHALQVQDHLRAQVLVVVRGRHREVALLVAGPVAEVRVLGRAHAPTVPGPRFGVDVVEAEVVALVEAHVVEDEELELGADVDGVGEPGALHVGLGLLGHVAGIAAVVGARDRVLHVADQHECGHRGKGVHLRRRGVREEQHVRLVDRLEPPDGGAVEADALGEEVLGQLGHGDGEVLPETGHVDEPEVHDLCALLPGQLENVACCHSASFRQW